MLESRIGELEEKAAAKADKRKNKKRPKMKVDGAGVKDLYRLLNKR